MMLVIRADAGARMGTGHLMRCLALAQACRDAGGQVVFATACSNPALVGRLRAEGFEVRRLERAHPDVLDWQATSRLLEQHRRAWLVLDGYHLDSDYERRAKDAGHPVAVIDDLARPSHHSADILLNPSVHAEGLSYSCEPYTRLLLGPRYALLRREFTGWRGWKREIVQEGRRVLVTLGGSDPVNLTAEAIRALGDVPVPGLEAAVAIGAANAHREAILKAAARAPFPVRVAVDAAEMPALMAWADLAVAAAGSTSAELAFMGLPAVLVTVAENQRPVAAGLARAGVAVDLGWHRDLSRSDLAQAIARLLRDPHTRSQMSRSGRARVDEKGARRAWMAMQAAGSPAIQGGNGDGTRGGIRLRRARHEDYRLLWEWANDPTVRAESFSPDPIPWERHVEWFTRKLHDRGCLLLVALEDGGDPVGQVRFDAAGEEAEISVSVERSRRGCGYGCRLIEMAVSELFASMPVRTVHAFIRPQNTGSIRAFEKARFTRVGTRTVRGCAALHYALERSGG